MIRAIFVNLPVKDLQKSVTFYEALGFSFNPRFSNDKGACLVISDSIQAMLLTESFFQGFTPKTLADSRELTEVLLCLSCESDDEVHTFAGKVTPAGGRLTQAPKDLGFMLQIGFEDPDGHMWELVHMRQMPEAA